MTRPFTALGFRAVSFLELPWLAQARYCAAVNRLLTKKHR